MYRIYLRDPDQHVREKTVTSDPGVALAAFSALVNRTDLDDCKLLAVLNRDGKPVAHHDFRQRPDGSPIDPMKWWRGRLDQLDLAEPA